MSPMERKSHGPVLGSPAIRNALLSTTAGEERAEYQNSDYFQAQHAALFEGFYHLEIFVLGLYIFVLYESLTCFL